MSDDQQWQSPGGYGAAVPPAPGVTPPAAPPTFPAATPGSSGRSSGYPPPPRAWTPPPKPGLIPLRPLDLGTILGASFRVFRRNPKPTFGAALLIQGIVYLLLALVVTSVIFFSASRISSSTEGDSDAISAGATVITVLALLIPIVFAALASVVLQGVIILEASRGTVGEKLTFRELFARAKGRIGALIGWAALVSLALIIVVGALVVAITLVAAFLGTAGIVTGVLIGVFGSLGLLVVLAWLSVKLGFVSSILMIERLSIRRSIARSWSLTRGFFWRTFGILLLVAVIVGTVSQVVSFPISFLSPLIVQLTDPQGQGGANVVVVVAVLAIIALGLLIVVQAVVSVVQSATIALLYIDLRIRKEGLDLQLARFVEARDAGDDDIVDPLLHPVDTAGAGRSWPPPPPAYGSPWG